MAQRTWRAVLTGGTLIATLALASPVQAHAATGLSFGDLWNWLASSRGERIATLGAGMGRGHRRSGRVVGVEKAGGCVDPNGCANPNGASTSICTAHGNRSACIEPNS
jgi:hypothetical protein